MSKQKPVILAALAHPDDESFGMGGTLALYAKRGVDVYLVCATRGEVGEADPEQMKGFASIAEMRENELRCAAGHLGLKEVFFLDYRDSGMPGSPDNQHPDAQVAHPVEEVAVKVLKYIRELKPDVVLTFDPIGGYRHPDHIHIHNATVLAFEKANDASFHPEAGAPFQAEKLYFHTFPRTLLKVAVNLLPLIGKDPRKFGRNGDIDMKALADVSFPVHAQIAIGSVAKSKAAASACHASQGGGIQISPGLTGILMRLLGEKEDFMQASPPVAAGAKIKKDLFD
jgi:LmbE family N-acetylglucosaminyl deacetylase